MPGAQEILPKAVRAVIDGTNAAGTFIPALQLLDPAGDVMWTALDRNLQLAPGVTTSVSWFPRVVGQTVSLGGPPGSGCVRFVGPPTGNATQDAAAIQAAHDSLPATGGIVQLCRGAYGLDDLLFSKPIQLSGHGGVSADLVNAATVLNYGSSTGTAITVTATGNVILRDFFLRNTSNVTPTVGFGILNSGNSNGCQYLGLGVSGFYECVSISTGNSWAMQRCHISDYVLRGLHIDNTVNGDQGDMQVLGNWFFHGPNNVGAANSIDWRGGGGMRCVANKFNAPAPGNANSTHILMKYSEAADTGVQLIQGNSIENAGDGVQLVTNAGSGTCIGIVIANNEINVQTTCLNLSPGTAGVYGNITVNGNVLESATNGIVLGNIDWIVNGGNSFRGVANDVVVNAGVTNHTQYGVG